MAVVAGLDDVRVELQPVAGRRRLEVDLVDVEAEIVQSREPRVELVTLVGTEGLLACELAPEVLVAADDLLADLIRVDPRRQARLRVDVEQLADDVRLRDVDVVGTLAVGELAMQLA